MKQVLPSSPCYTYGKKSQGEVNLLKVTQVMELGFEPNVAPTLFLILIKTRVKLAALDWVCLTHFIWSTRI